MAVTSADLFCLSAIELTHIGGVEGAVAMLPTSLRAKLAEGPWPEPHCGICRALDNDDTLGRHATPAMLLLGYHDEPLGWLAAGMTRVAKNRAVYEHCLRIYRAAGWDG